MGNNTKEFALITGASSGIGYEFAKIFAAKGYHLILTARTIRKLEEIKRELAAKYTDIQIHIIAKDLSTTDGAEELFREVRHKNIPVHILVNNAGFGLLGPFSETDLARNLQMIQLNITSLVILTRRFLPQMIERNSGKILNVASTAGFVPGPYMSVYYATKAFVLSFSRALHKELETTDITVTALCPGATATQFSKTAHMENIPLFKSMFASVMSAEQVARIGFRSLMSGKPVVITGFFNKLMMFSIRFTPRRFVIHLTALLMKQ